MWSARLLLAVIALGATTARSEHKDDICDRPFCECIPSTHPMWTTVNCTLSNDENLDIIEGFLPDSTTELIINGGDTVLLDSNSLTRLRDARYIYVNNANQLLMRKHAANAVNIVNIALDIKNCGMVRIESRAFANIKGPLTANITQCNHVQIDGEALSWILELSISNIHQLQLGSKAFMLDSTANNYGDHGPGMKIELKKLSIAEVSSKTFGSSAAQILLDNVEINTIRKEAFSANTYNKFIILNSNVQYLEEEAISQKTLINNLHVEGSHIYQLQSKVLQSAIGNLRIVHSRIDYVSDGAINATVASVVIKDTKFINVGEKGFEFLSWNRVEMTNNTFKNLDRYAFTGSTGGFDELIYQENAMYDAHKGSLAIVGQAYTKSSSSVFYQENYSATPCHCNIDDWFAFVLDLDTATPFLNDSLCTIDEIFARCFNEPDLNMVVESFFEQVCRAGANILCEPYKTKTNGTTTELKNPMFPDRSAEDNYLNARNNKVIAIMIISIIGFTLLVLFISLVKWMKQRGYCLKIKDMMISNGPCSPFCNKICGYNGSLDNDISISQLTVNEFSERHRLNDESQDAVPETTLPRVFTAAEVMLLNDKATQTLPEELTKELLESLREKLDDPENYVEARETIEHLYELIKVEENCNNTPSPNLLNIEENIYELPFQTTMPRIGKNNKQMVSTGTRVPSLDKLTPLSPYNRQTALSHDYFEPKDMTVHLYAEIANNEKERKGTMPDVVGDQPTPRGPYLRAVRDKNVSPTPRNKASKNNSQQNSSTLKSNKSNKSNTSNSSAKMLNRPLPEKPTTFDPGEGTSYRSK